MCRPVYVLKTYGAAGLITSGTKVRLQSVAGSCLLDMEVGMSGSVHRYQERKVTEQRLHRLLRDLTAFLNQDCCLVTKLTGIFCRAVFQLRTETS